MDNNPQNRNVGNLGDILKHAALVNLAQLHTARNKSKVAYIETHAFKLEATCPNSEQWAQEVTDEISKYPAYGDYFAAERTIMDNKPYRCSAGLVIDILKKSGAIDPIIVLAEKDTDTRRTLQEQLTHEGNRYFALLDEAASLSSFQFPGNISSVLLLVDPFSLDDQLWQTVSATLESIMKPGMDVILEVFNYDKTQTVIPWPASSKLIGPVSVMHRQPYHLAVYATESIRSDIKRCCSLLGWQQGDSL